MITVDEMIAAHRAWLTAAGLARTTVSDAARCLRQANREMSHGLPTADRTEITAWLASPQWSAQTRKTYRDHVVRFFRWAADPADPWLDRDPTVGIPAPRVPRRLPRPAPDRLVWAACTVPPMPYLLHCRLAAYGGLRPCEIARLHRGHISADWVTVHQGKGGRSRRVPTHRLVWDLVRDMPDGPVTHRARARVTARWVAGGTAALLRRRGIDTSLYPLRHWYATRAQMAQGDARVTQELLGHASLATTMVYTQVSDSRLRSTVDALPPPPSAQ